MKPPVEAPTSRQIRPAGSIANASSAAASLCPPRETYGSGASTASTTEGSTRSPDLRSRRARSPSPTRTRPARTRACARVRDSARPRSTSSWSSRRRAGRPAWIVSALTALSWHSPPSADRAPAASRAGARPGSGVANRDPASLRRGRRGDAEGLERLADLALDAGSIEPDEPAQVGDRAVVDEPVARDPDDPERPRRGRPGRPAAPPRGARGRPTRSRRSRRSPRGSRRAACRGPSRG